MSKFNKYNFGRFPVIDKKNNLVGIVTKGTIVSGLLKRLDIKTFLARMMKPPLENKLSSMKKKRFWTLIKGF